MIKQNIPHLVQTQKQKLLLMKVILMIYFCQFVLQLYQTYKNILEKILVGLLIQLWIN